MKITLERRISFPQCNFLKGNYFERTSITRNFSQAALEIGLGMKRCDIGQFNRWTGACDAALTFALYLAFCLLAIISMQLANI